MGAVLPGKAGAGSAVNDTTRELGGTLGVAVVGSVLASVYSAHVLRSLTNLGAPAAAAAAAQKSVVAGLTTAAHLPPALQSAAAQAARQAFVDGLSAGSLVAAAGTAAAAVAALAFLPARAKEPRLAARQRLSRGGPAGRAGSQPTSAAQTQLSRLGDQDPGPGGRMKMLPPHAPNRPPLPARGPAAGAGQLPTIRPKAARSSL